jgi:DNA-binding NtrC family response regulator
MPGSTFERGILLLEDTIPLQQTLMSWLEDKGWGVQACEKVRQAYSALDSKPEAFRLVISDVSLLDGDSLDFLADRVVGVYQFIVMTSNTELVLPSSISKATLALLHKPFTLARLAELLAQVASK